jgi:large subunit ribosomal protein L18
MSIKTKKDLRIRRHLRVRNKIQGTAQRPRMAVFRSNKQLQVQLIDDDARCTLLAASVAGKNAEAAKALGEKVAGLMKDKGISSVVFDRGGFAYGSNFKILADSARAAGLKF